MSYTKKPQNIAEILEEDNYYPFGLKHEGYNGYVATDNKYKYQGQERQDELSLNWDSFKWRNYDYAIGRFMSIDPLAEDYKQQSPYNFSENRVVDGIELEGLEHLSISVYQVHKDNRGRFNATKQLSTTQQNVGTWSGTKSQNQYQVYNSDNMVTAIFSGDNSKKNMENAGILVSNFNSNETAFQSLKKAVKYIVTSNDREAKNFRETSKNVIAGAGVVVAAPAVATGEAGILVYAGLTADLDKLAGVENGNLSDNIENENIKTTIGVINLFNALSAKNSALLEIGTNGIKAPNVFDSAKSIYDATNTINQLNNKKDEKK